MSTEELIMKLMDKVHALLEDETPDVIVSCKEAARYLGVTQQTISARIRQGSLAKRTVGGVTGIPLRMLTKTKKKYRREAGEPQSS